MKPRRRLARHPFLPISERKQMGAFRLNGRPIPFCEGDTVASSAWAAGVTILSRSFKYHRPRGLYDGHGYGAEALVTVNGEPNLAADLEPARQGLDVRTQNAWPSVEFDLMALNDWFVPLLPNGFYYKMFHKPRWAWPWFEVLLRNAAGLGRIDRTLPDSSTRYEKRYLFPDLCVIGGGPAGLAVALAGSKEKKQVLLIERFSNLGGHSNFNFSEVKDCPDADLNGLREYEAVRRLADRVSGDSNIQVLKETTAFGIYEDRYVAAQNRRDLFKIRAGSVIVAGGANDRHVVFGNNDLPGIMTARGVERLTGLHGIVPGERATVITNHDGGYHTARVLVGAGVEVTAVVDSRPEKDTEKIAPILKELRVPMIGGHTIRTASGRKWVNSVTIVSESTGQERTLECDLLVMAVGYVPQLGLLSMGRGKPGWDPQRQIFRMQDLPHGLYAAGEVNGSAGLGHLYREGREIGMAAARAEPAPESIRDESEWIAAPAAEETACGAKSFVCKCMDVTSREVRDSIAEGFDQLETLKRFTGLGMGPCQGKTCYEAAARIVGACRGDPSTAIAPTTMRPPFAPVSFGVLAGRAPHLQPVRRSPIHDRHVQGGARFLNAGLWKRPERYVGVQDEVVAVRTRLGIIDVSTLGKLEISGPDALKFLHFMMPGEYSKLKVGRVRYHTMINEDGVLFEDGTLAHIEPGRYFISTTTGNAAAVHSRFWWWITTGGYDVRLKDLGSILAAVNVSGPKSREYLADLVDIDLSNEAIPYMSCRRARVAGVEVTLFRIGFTGELSYEIHFPAEYGETMWDFLLEKGASCRIQPFGVEAQRVLRLEKGHLIPGIDTDALTDPYDAGVGFTIRDQKDDFIGRTFLQNMKDRDRHSRLVTYRLDAGSPIPPDGTAMFDRGRVIGRVTSSRMSPTLGRGIGLGWVEEVFSRRGSRVQIRFPSGRSVDAEVLEGHAAYDPEGDRLRS
ncbi:MAG: 2Fe-2S iron-sulfur cluster-binding protein [Acidobacteriota bacterium]